MATDTEAMTTRSCQVRNAVSTPSATSNANSVPSEARRTNRPVRIELATFQCLLTSAASLDARRSVGGRCRLCHNRQPDGPRTGGIDGEGPDAKQQRSQETEIGQTEEFGVRIQEIARGDGSGSQSAGEEILI